MEAEIFNGSQTIKLNNLYGIFRVSHTGSNSGLLSFKIDWSENIIPPGSIDIKIKLLTISTYNFSILDIPDVKYNIEAITYQIEQKNGYCFIPFKLDIIQGNIGILAKFYVEITGNGNSFKATDTLSLKLAKKS